MRYAQLQGLFLTFKIHIYKASVRLFPSTVYFTSIDPQWHFTNALILIGLLSEEAQEACNKHYNIFRENHTRKISRMSSNTDLMHTTF